MFYFSPNGWKETHKRKKHLHNAATQWKNDPASPVTTPHSRQLRRRVHTQREARPILHPVQVCSFSQFQLPLLRISCANRPCEPGDGDTQELKDYRFNPRYPCPFKLLRLLKNRFFLYETIFVSTWEWKFWILNGCAFSSLPVALFPPIVALIFPVYIISFLTL